jgi:hypothetical protein
MTEFRHEFTVLHQILPCGQSVQRCSFPSCEFRHPSSSFSQNVFHQHLLLRHSKWFSEKLVALPKFRLVQTRGCDGAHNELFPVFAETTLTDKVIKHFQDSCPSWMPEETAGFFNFFYLSVWHAPLNKTVILCSLCPYYCDKVNDIKNHLVKVHTAWMPDNLASVARTANSRGTHSFRLSIYFGKR